MVQQSTQKYMWHISLNRNTCSTPVYTETHVAQQSSQKYIHVAQKSASKTPVTHQSTAETPATHINQNQNTDDTATLCFTNIPKNKPLFYNQHKKHL